MKRISFVYISRYPTDFSAQRLHLIVAECFVFTRNENFSKAARSHDRRTLIKIAKRTPNCTAAMASRCVACTRFCQALLLLYIFFAHANSVYKRASANASDPAGPPDDIVTIFNSIKIVFHAMCSYPHQTATENSYATLILSFDIINPAVLLLGVNRLHI